MIKDRGYVLIIAEKPKAAAKIAKAMRFKYAGKVGKVPVWRGMLNGRRAIIASTAGHLFTLETKDRGYPVFSYYWVPRWRSSKEAYLKRFYQALRTLSGRASEFINACDYDIEGSVIGYNIVRYLGDVRRAKRVKFSSLTEEEIRKAFSRPGPLDWDLIEAGLCRHELDWIWGINVSRALMDILNILSGNRAIHSAGRVQSPTLNEVYKRHIIRETYVPTPLFNVLVTVELDGRLVKLETLGAPFKSLSEAKAVADKLRGLGYGVIEKVIRERRAIGPPPPFNLTDLQLESSRIYKIPPSETLKIAEDLYLDALISYPRTNSQKLPLTLNNKQIILSLSRIAEYRGYALTLLKKSLLRPVQGKKDDPAHPAIYPTANTSLVSKLGGKHRRIYDLIARRYLASFGDNLLVSVITYRVRIGSKEFTLSGRSIIKRGWLLIYPFIRIQEAEIPELREGDRLPIKEVKVVRTLTKPPPRYTRATLLKWMEASGIGTEATRAEIIETLFKRGYLRSFREGLDITDTGMFVAEILYKVFRELTGIELTKEFERYLNLVRSGKLSREDVVNKAKAVLAPRLLDLRKTVMSNNVDVLKRLINWEGDVRCSLCNNPGTYVINDKLVMCKLHKQAYDNVMVAYRRWREALGIDFENYLNKLKNLSSVGKYCKDVITLLLRQKGSNS